MRLLRVLWFVCCVCYALSMSFSPAAAPSRLTRRHFTGLKAASKILRDAKRWFSSDLEAQLLRLTRPDNQLIAAADVDALCVQLLEDRQCLLAALSKISRKIEEPDPRTKIKALHLLHLLLQKMKGDNLDALCEMFELLLETTDPKSNMFHFDLGHALSPQKTRVDTAETARLLKFAQNYAKYVSVLMLQPNLEVPDIGENLPIEAHEMNDLLTPVIAMQQQQTLSAHPLVAPCMAATRSDLHRIHRLLEKLAKTDLEASTLLHKHQQLFPKQITRKASKGAKASKRLLTPTTPKRLPTHRASKRRQS